MKLTKSEIKASFSRGRRPTEQDFGNMIDSMLHIDEQAAVDSRVVNTRVATYDTDLKTRSQNGEVDTLGDVFFVMDNLNDDHRLLSAPNLTYTSTPERVTDTTKLDPQPVQNPGPQHTGVNPVRKWLLADIAVLTGSNVIHDIQIERRWISIPTGGAPVTFYTDVIVGIRVGSGPKVNLQES